MLSFRSTGPEGTHRPKGRGFTLLELLVVIVLLGILASLITPAAGRVKERARMSVCFNNLHQIGVAVRLYIQENVDRYPTTSGKEWRSFRLGGGDPDPKMAAAVGMEAATNRILWPYTNSREMYRCPADRGMNLIPWQQPFNSTYAMTGTSYKYNEGPWCAPTLRPEKDPYYGLSGKNENWLSQPSRYVLIHEPPATPYFDGGWFYFFWHRARGPNTVFSRSRIRDPFISPVLFADGHASEHDFTRAILSRSDYPFESTPAWYLYEPAQGAP